MNTQQHAPTYLRVVATTRCPLVCSYCHMEGDPHQEGTAFQLDSQTLEACLAVAIDAGVRKIKFLGGEPLVRKDLAAQVARLRRRAPDADLSVITSGVAAVETVKALFDAGLSRMNLSIHGFGLEAFAQRSRRPAPHHALRAQVIDTLLRLGRPLKLNYVYGGPADEADLAELLRWGADKPVLINVLDDLGNAALGAEPLMAVLKALRGPWQEQWQEPDPDSLATTRLRWGDGLQVEVKTSQLGLVAPFADCERCPARQRCREGIYAVRLTHRGQLQLCMDRPDLSFSLVDALGRGHEAGVAAWRDFVGGHLRGAVARPLVSAPRRLPVLQAGQGVSCG